MNSRERKAEADAPLLPVLRPQQNEEVIGGASVSGAVFNISTSIIGAGIMSIPATLKVLGIVPAFIAIVIVACLVETTVEFLLRYTHSGESVTYAGVMAESFGQFGSVAVQICVVISNLGCLIIYLIIIGDVLSGNQSGGTLHLGVLQEWFGIQWWNSRPVSLLFIAIFVLLPLILLRRVDSLRHSSAISILLALVFIAICSAMAIYAVWEGKAEKLRLLPDFSNGFSFLNLFTTIPVFVTGFGFHMVVHPIGAELNRPCDMSTAARISLILCVAIYFAIGFFGYLLFGDSIMADMLVNFDQTSAAKFGSFVNNIVRLSYALHLLLVFPVMNYSLRANVDELLFPNRQDLVTDTPRFLSLTCILLALSYGLAVALPNIWYFFQFMGSTTFVCLSFIFPGAIVLKDIHGISTRRDRIIAVAVILLAVASSLIAISSNLYTSTS